MQWRPSLQRRADAARRKGGQTQGGAVIIIRGRPDQPSMRRSRRRYFKPGAGGFKILARTFCSGLAAQPSRVTASGDVACHSTASPACRNSGSVVRSNARITGPFRRRDPAAHSPHHWVERYLLRTGRSKDIGSVVVVLFAEEMGVRWQRPAGSDGVVRDFRGKPSGVTVAIDDVMDGTVGQ